MPRLVSGKTFVPGVCVNSHLVSLQQEVFFSFCPSVFLLQIQWPRTPPLSTHLALVTLTKDLISKHSHTEGQDRALVHEWGVGRETHRVDKAAVQQVSCMFAWERRRHDITYIPGKQSKHCQIPVVTNYEPKTLYRVCIFYLDTIVKQHSKIDIAIVVLILKNLCMYVIVCMLCVCVFVCMGALLHIWCVIMSTQVPWRPCGGHRRALGVSLHLPPCIRQDLFTVGHCVHQASRPMSSQDSPVSTSHLP